MPRHGAEPCGLSHAAPVRAARRAARLLGNVPDGHRKGRVGALPSRGGHGKARPALSAGRRVAGPPPDPGGVDARDAAPGNGDGPPRHGALRLPGVEFPGAGFVPAQRHVWPVRRRAAGARHGGGRHRRRPRPFLQPRPRGHGSLLRHGRFCLLRALAGPEPAARRQAAV